LKQLWNEHLERFSAGEVTSHFCGEWERIKVEWEKDVVQLETWFYKSDSIRENTDYWFSSIDYDTVQDLDLGPNNSVYREMRNRFIQSLWEDVCRHLTSSLKNGKIVAVARVGSPFSDPFSVISADVWRHLTVNDWRAGTAVAITGEQLFSVHILREPGPGPATEIERDNDRSRQRQTVHQRAIQRFMLERHPSGKPDGVAFDALAAEYGEWVAGRRDAREQVWPATITGRGLSGILQRLDLLPRSERSERSED
jgi:hypothetical protein